MNEHTEEKALATTQENKPVEFKETLKFKTWVKLYYDKSNPETYGNATASAMEAYNCKNRASAGQIGHENLKKLEGNLRQVAENEGITLPVLAKKLLDSAKDYEQIRDLIALLGYVQVPTDQSGNSPQNSFTFNLQNLQQTIAQQRKDRGLE